MLYELIADLIEIEANMWNAAAVTVPGGVTIGRSSVFAASSVVAKKFPADSLVRGNPADGLQSIIGE